ncbi:MAG: translesion error-prone DNA polymerase V autoproteolytic subunit [Arenicella sp.]
MTIIDQYQSSRVPQASKSKPQRLGIRSWLKIPFFSNNVKAGFPSPAQDYVEKTLDLNDLCIKHPSATYFVRCDGDSMIDAGIHQDDVLVVDRALSARHGDIVIASVEGEFTVKRLETKPFVQLVAMNADYQNIIPAPEQELEVFGVVTFVIHALSTRG